jgi:hypothetical protein
MRTELPDTGDPHDMRGKPPYELEIIVAEFGGFGAGVSDLKKAGAARGELIRQWREHERDLVDMQLEAAKSVKWATILAAVAATLSAISTLIQAFR